MQRTRKKHISPIALFLLVAMIGGLGGMIYAPVRQERLNRALIAAIKKNDTQAALTLLAQGADPNSRDDPPHHLSLWRLILDKLRGRQSVAHNPAGRPALIVALMEPWSYGRIIAHSDNPAIIQALLNKGADVNARDEMSDSKAPALMWAIEWRYKDIIQVLIRHGARVNITDGRGDTAFVNAVRSGDVDTVKLLLANGADVNLATDYGATPLSQAQGAIVKMLQQAGAKE